MTPSVKREFVFLGTKILKAGLLKITRLKFWLREKRLNDIRSTFPIRRSRTAGLKTKTPE